MRFSTGLLLGAVAALAVAAAGWWTFWSSSSTGRADPGDVRQVAHGEVVYQLHCASCHGAKLEGQPDWQIRKPDDRLPAPPHDESGHTWHHPDDVLFGITKHGIAAYAPPSYASDMPAFAEVLTDDEIWAVLAYIKSRWPEKIRARQPARNGGANR